MTSEVRVNSAICGFKHKIIGELDGKTIIADIETDCKKVAKISHMEIPKKETRNIKENYVMNQAQDVCCTTCIVPAGVMHVCNMELGMLSKTLAKQSERVSIEFNDE
ncbi:hypothetical protein RE476_03405 [Methanolobus mangrovi]|uniref:Uncharacterized protein n=1 Tax=Methanolobus mangrovi TaxID=3072977 RepID=A0AA51UHB7_9EURY|nr:hypothetical protein [Methanolobus mangrovi]WMW22884.1 hypothetical protein RE476_03405 [Methanolobus mangrovi]